MIIVLAEGGVLSTCPPVLDLSQPVDPSTAPHSTQAIFKCPPPCDHVLIPVPLPVYIIIA